MVLPLILGLPYTVAAGILCGQRISRNLSTRTGSSVPSHSSTTNTVMSLAGFVLLALELTLKYLYSMKSLNPLLSIQQSLYWHDRWSALVLDQDHQEFRRLGTACVPVNDMNIVGAFIERLSWCQCYLLSTHQLHHNGALQHVNKGMCIVSVDRARSAGRMLDCEHESFPAGTLRQIFRHERCDLGLLSHRRTGHEAQQNQCNAFDRHSRLFRSSPGTSSCQRMSPWAYLSDAES